MTVDHIAFLIRQLETMTGLLPEFCTAAPVECFPGEGTREQYVEVAGTKAPRLLLIQPTDQGPYLNAMKKRGPGLHHIGCFTGSIKEMLPHFTKHRLLLHPISIDTIQHGTVWLCRPELPFLIELTEKEEPEKSSLQTEMLLPSSIKVPVFIHGLFTDLTIGNSNDCRFHLSFGNHSLCMDLCK